MTTEDRVAIFEEIKIQLTGILGREPSINEVYQEFKKLEQKVDDDPKDKKT